MARFDVVHANVKIPDNLKPGEPFRFVLREPRNYPVDKITRLNKLGYTLLFNIEENSHHYVLTVTIDHTGRLVPFDEANKRLLDDWKSRHRTTPESDFV